MGGSIQILGALFILSAFVLGQAGRLDPRRAASLSLNLIGASILALDAAIHAQLGFLLLEGVWALVSMRGLVALLLTRRVAAGS